MKYLLAAILFGSLLLCSDSSALAQHGGKGGGASHGGGGQHGGSGYHGGNYYGGYHGGNYYGHGSSYGNYWYPGVGFYFGFPLWFNYPWGYSRYDYGIGAPYYSGSNYYGSADSYTPPTTSSYPPATAPSPAETGDPSVANLEVRLPENATLWIEGQQVGETGAVRHFVSPPLEKDKGFTYNLRARWTDANGQVIERTKKVDVKAGAWIGVDFIKQS